ncbi:MAG: 3-hydroxyacyl-ACP dehydratase FabZ family protein [Gemmatales bacterium]
MRWIWVDRFTEFESKKSAKSIKNLSLAEDHYAQHFPGYPVMPVSLMLEGLAQTGGILVGEANNFQEKVVLAKISNAKFHREALAGETLSYETVIIDLRPEGATIQGTVKIGTETLGTAEIMFMHLDKARSGAIFGDRNFVFAGDLGNLLGMSRVKNAPPPTS